MNAGTAALAPMRRRSAAARGGVAVADDNSDMEIWRPAVSAKRKKVEDVLLANGLVDPEQLQQARTVQQTSRGKRVSQILLEMGAVKEEDIQKSLAEVTRLPFEMIDPKGVERRAYEALPAEFMKQRGCMVLRYEEAGKITIGMVDPANVFLLDEVKRKTNSKSLSVAVVCLSAINAAIEAVNASSDQNENFDEIMKDMGEEDVELVEEEKEDVTDLTKASAESPVIRLVNYLIFDGVKQGASDIHIEPHEKRLVVRYRIDGVLFDAMTPPPPDELSCCEPIKDYGEYGYFGTAHAARWTHPHRGARTKGRFAREHLPNAIWREDGHPYFGQSLDFAWA